MYSKTTLESRFNNQRSCGCGCDELIPTLNVRMEPQYFKKGHTWKDKINPNLNQDKRGKYHHNWRGGKYKDATGYIRSQAPNHHRADKLGYVMEHILVYEKYHKCCVLLWGNIHHKNGKRDDNKIQNLLGMTGSQHIRYHRIQDLQKYGVTNFCKK